MTTNPDLASWFTLGFAGLGAVYLFTRFFGLLAVLWDRR